MVHSGAAGRKWQCELWQVYGVRTELGNSDVYAEMADAAELCPCIPHYSSFSS